MKISQLPYGARFLYQGEEYVKTGPMLATGKDGQKIIPRYVILQALDEPPPPPRGDVRLAKADVLGAFEAFVTECAELVSDDRRSELDAARERFLRTLG